MERRREKNLRRGLYPFFVWILASALLSCLPEQELAKGKRVDKSWGITGNDPSLLPRFHSRILKKGPILVYEDAKPSDFLYRFLDPESAFITSGATLEYDCDYSGGVEGSSQKLSGCMSVKQNEVARATRAQDGKWAYATDSKEFLEVNAFYHVREGIKEFFRLQRSSIARSTELFDSHSAIPRSLAAGGNSSAFWFRSGVAGADEHFNLKIYSDCQKKGRPFFLFGSLEVCLGDHEEIQDLNFSEDPDIIHHEIGHFFSTVLYNQRNVASQTLAPDRRASFGGYGYSEMDLISEGISDWFAHHHSGRTRIFEWAGKFSQNDRPVTEEDELHDLNNLGLAASSGDRLRYPDSINYYHYDPLKFLPEDVQQAGMVISHLLVALGKEIENTCMVSPLRSRELVFHLIQESLAELGDLTSKGRDGQTLSTINMIPQVSDTWAKIYTAANPRLFAQKMAKHFFRIIDAKSSCNGVVFGREKFEKLLDSYGLLLFRTYNENGNCDEDTDPANGQFDCLEGTLTSVMPENRRISTLLPKTALTLDTRENSPSDGFFIFDSMAEIKQRLAVLRASGLVLPQNLGRVDLVNPDNNNGNQKITPGELVGIALNLFNDSNVSMGGVQTLANDWDHVKVKDGRARMCNTFEDAFPSIAEGGAEPDTTPLSEGDCGYITRENGKKITETKEITAPICFMLLRDANETRWVDQKEYMEEIGDNSSGCLKEDEPLSCYFRAVPGADQAWYSKIDPKANWVDTYSTSSYFTEQNKTFKFEGSNIMLFEVNENLPVGTEINCRFRARFTNCDDCWHDPNSSLGDDYLDFEFAGARPYRLFNVMFTVLD
ncbi:MAG: hypothetical protein OXB88_08155 [Bacteriovoracales bacterium]|nr:hypothetical protein [Bacteriovoracales bacterium]